MSEEKEAKRDIRSLDLEGLRAFFLSKGEQAFRADQVYQWLWQKGAHSFEVMTNLSKTTRALLEASFVINHIAVDRQQRSADQTIKNAIRLHDGLTVESVLIPTATRSTACVSSQVGCSLDCTFCATSQLKRMRNLNPDEIYDQVMALDRQSRLYFDRPLTNIVFMGMGEPLMNYKNVIAAVDKITSGLAISPKRITISTSGIPKMIEKLADENPKFQLAVSLHSAEEKVRNTIMPFSTSFDLDTLLKSLQYWYQQTRSKVTFEYLIWKGINDTQSAIDALVSYAKKVPSKVNIIEYNPTDAKDFKAADQEVIERYIQALERARITVTVRRSRGKDIDAACGQLANKLVPLEH
ncbi:MAG: hypothetical protein RLZZ242_1387 [Bacteroidota bacterium]